MSIESGWGEEGVAAMMVTAMSLHGRQAADDATSQMVGWQMMQQERAVTTTTIITTPDMDWAKLEIATIEF